MPSEMPHFKLRLPAELLERIKDAAEASGRTQTAEMVRRLESSFSADGTFPLDVLKELKHFAAKSNPPTTARELALQLVRDGLSHLHDWAAMEEENNKTAFVHGLTDDEVSILRSLAEKIKAENKGINIPTSKRRSKTKK